MALRAEQSDDEREIWKEQNGQAISEAVAKLLSEKHVRPNKDGVIASVPLELILNGKRVQARVDYEAVVRAESRGNIDFYVHARLSIFPADAPKQGRKLPSEGPGFRPGEIAYTDAYLVPTNEAVTSLSARSYEGTAEEAQHNGLNRALIFQKEPFAEYVIRQENLLSDVKFVTYVIRDESYDRGSRQATNWTTRRVREMNAGQPPEKQYKQTRPDQPDYFEKVVTLQRK